MATYSQLLSELQQEAGSLPDNIPFLIREVESELWKELYFCAPEQIYTLTVPAGTETVSLPPTYQNFMQIKSLIDPSGNPLRRVSPSQYSRLKLRDSVPELFVFLWLPNSPSETVTQSSNTQSSTAESLTQTNGNSGSPASLRPM